MTNQNLASRRVGALKGSARGPRANYDEERLITVVLAFQLFDGGFTPARMKATIAQHWPEIRKTLAEAAADRREALYLATYPNALDRLRHPIDKDDIAWVHSGSLVQLADSFARRSVLDQPNYASLNLTGLLLSVATAIGNLAAPKEVAKATAEEFLSTVASWK